MPVPSSLPVPPTYVEYLEHGSVGAQPADERIDSAPVRMEPVRGDRIIVRCRSPRDVCTAGRVDHQPEHPVRAAATKVRRIDDLTGLGIELRHERVVNATERRLDRWRRDGKIRGPRPSCDEEPVVRSDGDRVAVVGLVAAEVRRERDDGVDDERTCPVVLIHVDTDGAGAPSRVPAADDHLRAADVLVDRRPPLMERACSGLDDEVALRTDADRGGAPEVQPDVAGVSVGRDDEVVFDLSVAAVEDDVDSGIDVRVPRGAEQRDVRTPLRFVGANEVMSLARQRQLAGRRSVAPAAGETHPNGCGPRGLRARTVPARSVFGPARLERHEDFARAEAQRVVPGTRDVRDAGVELPAVLLEGDRNIDPLAAIGGLLAGLAAR